MGENLQREMKLKYLELFPYWILGTVLLRRHEWVRVVINIVFLTRKLHCQRYFCYNEQLSHSSDCEICK